MKIIESHKKIFQSVYGKKKDETRAIFRFPPKHSERFFIIDKKIAVNFWRQLNHRQQQNVRCSFSSLNPIEIPCKTILISLPPNPPAPSFFHSRVCSPFPIFFYFHSCIYSSSLYSFIFALICSSSPFSLYLAAHHSRMLILSSFFLKLSPKLSPKNFLKRINR